MFIAEEVNFEDSGTSVTNVFAELSFSLYSTHFFLYNLYMLSIFLVYDVLECLCRRGEFDTCTAEVLPLIFHFLSCAILDFPPFWTQRKQIAGVGVDR